MVTFFAALALLYLGRMGDLRLLHLWRSGVDYVGMPTWKVFLIQLLNIARTGPIFGALMGAVFGPVRKLWENTLEMA